MDDLRPDVDEVRRFQQERSKSVKPKGTPGDAPKEFVPPVSPAKMPPSDPQASSVKFRPVAAKSPDRLLSLVLVLFIICLAVGGGYYVWQQQLLIDQMKENMLYAEDYIKQSKLLMARLEGRVYETDSEMEQSGSEFQQKLHFLDTEMRKLWGVAGDINKKAIAQNQSDIGNIYTVTKGLTDAFISQESKSQAQLKSIEAMSLQLSARADEIQS
jgi:uncharacterized protein HemX